MAVGDAYVFPGSLTPVLTPLFFPKRLLFSHASAEVTGEYTPERKVASTGDRTHNHQVMSQTRSPLSYPGGDKKVKGLWSDKNSHPIHFPNKPWFLYVCCTKAFENTVGKGEIARNEQFLLFPQCFLPFWITFCHLHQI